MVAEEVQTGLGNPGVHCSVVSARNTCRRSWKLWTMTITSGMAIKTIIIARDGATNATKVQRFIPYLPAGGRSWSSGSATGSAPASTGDGAETRNHKGYLRTPASLAAVL